MNLSERLERAKLERDLAAGRVTSAAALRPEPADDPRDQGDILLDPVSIEVRQVGLVSVADSPPASWILDDAPAIDDQNDRCPTCNRIGRVDMVDLVGHRTHYTCDACGAMWNVHDQPGPG